MGKQAINQNGNQNIVGNNNVIKNHFNTNINIPLVCFGGDNEREKMLQIIKDNLNILYKPIETDVSQQEQITNRIGEFVQVIYRNPNHKELKNIYTKHDFEQSIKDNVFTYVEEKWHIGDWDKVGKDIIGRIYLALSSIGNKVKRGDVLNVMKTIFIASGNGDKNITDDNLQELYCEIGRRMGFKTLVLK